MSKVTQLAGGRARSQEAEPGWAWKSAHTEWLVGSGHSGQGLELRAQRLGPVLTHGAQVGLCP